MAADTGNIETVRLLLDRGADPDPATPLSQKITERMIESLANCTEEEAQKPIFAIDIYGFALASIDPWEIVDKYR
ncbi:hypothetical protein N7465_003308 [Penicillium sp. CMV-2018d]|nr:hypothetical protein N7465_003308 [Penicillium sp. CMV-2018d]